MDKSWLEQKYLVEQLSTRQIAEEYGMTQIAVWRLLKKYGIPSRTYKQNKMPTPKGGHLSSEHKAKIAIAQKKSSWTIGLDIEKHPSYKIGKRSYRRKKLLKAALACAYCDAKEKKVINSNLHVHHIDHNRDNNMLENLIVLCASCHKKLHLGLISLDNVA